MFKKHISIIRDLKLDKKNKALTFTNFCFYIQKKNVKDKVKQFINYMQLTIKPEVILTIYLISGYSKFLLNNTPLDLELKQLSDNIILNINRECDKKTLFDKFIEYSNKFTIWKKNDLKEQTKYYIKSYYELEYIKKNCKEEIYKNSILPIQEKLKNNIIKLSGTQGLDELNNYKHKVMKVDKELITKIGINLKKAFWNKLKEDLEQDPPIMDSIPEILRDINIALKTLVPTNEAYRNELDEKIDYDFLKGLIDNNVFGFNHIFSLSHYIVDTIKELGMAENDASINNLKKWIDNIKNEPHNFKLSEYLPKIFENIMNRIEEIQKRIIEIGKNSNLL